jgi:hypothetical protein
VVKGGDVASAQHRLFNFFLLGLLVSVNTCRFLAEQLAAEVNMNASYVGRIRRLGALSPDMIDSSTRNHRLSECSLTRRFTGSGK